MKNIFATILIILLLSFSKSINECEEPSKPYWYLDINSKIVGEGPTLRKAFKTVQDRETDIQPANGFITLKLHISKTGKLCNIETFQIDESYRGTEFQNGRLVDELENIASGLSDWSREKNVKTYHLIRFKIKNGKIEEVF